LDRQANFYPPYSRLIEIIIKHTDKKIAHEGAHGIADELRNQMKGVNVLGPGEPMISKIRNEFLMSILIKIPRDRGRLNEIKSTILEVTTQLTHSKEFRNLKMIFDVDPV
ncbi:MAG: primosomal protein N', partial [Cytophaga sp.]|nr:primosomal protein N' [Cytophaga sp.]